MGVDKQSESDAPRDALAAKDADPAKRDARVGELEAQVVHLTEALDERQEALGRHSDNSNLSPFSDPLGRRWGNSAGNEKDRQKREKKTQRCKRGGQRSHRGVHRELLPPDQVYELDLYLGWREGCGESLPRVADELAKRYPFLKLEPLHPHVTEYRRHAVACPRCGHQTRAAYDVIPLPRLPRCIPHVLL